MAVLTVKVAEPLDAVLWRELGTLKDFERILTEQPHLAGAGAILPVGTEIDMPDPVETPSAPRQTIRLFG